MAQNELAPLVTTMEARISRFEKQLAKASGTVDRQASRQEKRWKTQHGRATKQFKAIGASIASGLALGSALGSSTRVIAEFGQAMSTVQAVTNATASEFSALEAKARSLGASTRFSAKEAADGMIELARAGFDTNEVLSSIEGTLLLAQSGALALSDAASITAGSINGFRLGAEDAGRVVDVLALAANSSATDVSDLGQAMSFVAPISATLGVSLEETAAAVSTLSDNNIKGTRAGTGLRQVFIKLAAAGFDFSKEAGGVNGVLEKLKATTLKSVDPAEQLAAASELVGDKQAASLLVLVNNINKIKDLDKAYLGAAGTATKVAKIMDDNLKGALLATKSRLEEVAIALGQAGGEQALIDALTKLQEILVFVAENADTFTKALVVLAATAGGLLSAKAFGGLLTMLAATRTSMLATAAASNVTAMSFKGLGVGVKALLVSLGPAGWVAIAAGAIAAFVMLGDKADQARSEFEKYARTMDDVSKTNKSIEADSKRLKVLHEQLAVAVRDGGAAAVEAKTLEISALNERISKNKELLKLKRDLLADQIAAGSETANALKVKQAKTAVGSSSLRNVSDEQSQAAIKRISDSIDAKAIAGLDLTKQEKKFRDLRIEVLENNIALEEAKERVKGLNDAIASQSAPDADMRSILGLDDSYSNFKDKPKGGTSPKLSDDEKDAAEAAAEAAAKKLASEIEVIRQVGKLESQQIKELLAERLASIEKSKLAETEKATLRANVHADAKKELQDLADTQADLDAQVIADLQAQKDEDFSANQDRLGYLAEIEAAQARMAGRGIEATRIELDSISERYEAELDYIQQTIDAKGSTPQLEAEKTDILAALAANRAERVEFERVTLEQIDAITNNDSRLENALAFIDKSEQAKLDRLTDYYGQKEALNAEHQEQMSQIEGDADLDRMEARLESYQDNISSLQTALSGASSALRDAGLEDSKAGKAIAKAEQVTAIGEAMVNTGLGVTEALKLGPAGIPLAATIGALGAVQVGVMASQTFDGGGRTGSGPRAGGVDGKGGEYAIVHPNEVIADMTKPGREVAGKSLQDTFGFDVPQSNYKASQFSNLSQSSVNVGGSSYTINGNADNEALSRLENMMANDRKNRLRDFNAMSNQRDKRKTSRQSRRVGL